MSDNILEVRNLSTYFMVEGSSPVRAVDGLSYTVERGECTAIIGESGSGKSVSVLSVMRLVPYPPGRIMSGEVIFDGEDLMKYTDEQMQELRGKRISMIFQEPSAALDPVMTIGKQIEEAIHLHLDMSKKDAHQKAIDLLAQAGIPNAEERVNQYPYEFSGGMQQRAMIAMAMCCDPEMLIADEPTTALDVTVQAQVLEQLNQLRRKFGTTLIIITHNLGIVARYATSVKIMYGGRLVEQGPTREIFRNPSHPYTVGLIKAVPRLDRPRSDKLYTIEGEPPDMSVVKKESCAFAARCKYATEQCWNEKPQYEEVGDMHTCACFHKEKAQEERRQMK